MCLILELFTFKRITAVLAHPVQSPCLNRERESEGREGRCCSCVRIERGREEVDIARGRGTMSAGECGGRGYVRGGKPNQTGAQKEQEINLGGEGAGHCYFFYFSFKAKLKTSIISRKLS